MQNILLDIFLLLDTVEIIHSPREHIQGEVQWDAIFLSPFIQFLHWIHIILYIQGGVLKSGQSFICFSFMLGFSCWCYLVLRYTKRKGKTSIISVLFHIIKPCWKDTNQNNKALWLLLLRLSSTVNRIWYYIFNIVKKRGRKRVISTRWRKFMQGRRELELRNFFQEPKISFRHT